MWTKTGRDKTMKCIHIKNRQSIQKWVAIVKSAAEKFNNTYWSTLKDGVFINGCEIKLILNQQNHRLPANSAIKKGQLSCEQSARKSSSTMAWCMHD